MGVEVGDESAPDGGAGVSGEEVVDATGHGVGVSVVTQRGAVIGLELILSSEADEREESRE